MSRMQHQCSFIVVSTIRQNQLLDQCSPSLPALLRRSILSCITFRSTCCLLKALRCHLGKHKSAIASVSWNCPTLALQVSSMQHSGCSVSHAYHVVPQRNCTPITNGARDASGLIKCQFDRDWCGLKCWVCICFDAENPFANISDPLQRSSWSRNYRSESADNAR